MRWGGLLVACRVVGIGGHFLRAARLLRAASSPGRASRIVADFPGWWMGSRMLGGVPAFWAWCPLSGQRLWLLSGYFPHVLPVVLGWRRGW